MADLPASSIAICKDLLPYTEYSLYNMPDLFSSREIERFAETVLARPELANACVGICVSRMLELEGIKRQLKKVFSDDEDDDDDSEWTDSSGELSEEESDQDGSAFEEEEEEVDMKWGEGASKPRAVTLPLLTRPYADQEHLGTPVGLQAVNRDTLVQLRRALVNLRYCASIGAELSAVLFDEFYVPGVASRLNCVACNMTGGGVLEKWGTSHSNMLYNARKLPALETLKIGGSTGTLPFDMADVEQLWTPRSWTLLDVTLERIHRFGPELKYLLQSLDRVVKVELSAIEAEESFGEALGLLPDTVSHLSITISLAPHGQDIFPDTPIPNIDKLGNYFPRLHHLHLIGRIFTPSTLFSSLRNTHLLCLTFGIDTPVSYDDLLSLIKGANSLQNLQYLGVSICFCPIVEADADESHAGWLPKPRWRDDLTRKDAKRLLKACEEEEVQLAGTIMCALKQCEHGDEEDEKEELRCPRNGAKCS